MVGPDATASLSELRRRAAHRLREIGAYLELVREQYEEAAAECARLRAGGGPAVARVAAQRAVGEDDATPDGEVRPHLAGQVDELGARLREATALLAAEHARSEKLEGRLRELETNLAEAHTVLEAERELSREAETEAGSLRAEVEQLRDEMARGSDGSADGWRKRVVQLQIDLRRARADGGQLRDEMAGLLRFLDELTEVLGAPAAVPP